MWQRKGLAVVKLRVRCTAWCCVLCPSGLGGLVGDPSESVGLFFSQEGPLFLLNVVTDTASPIYFLDLLSQGRGELQRPPNNEPEDQ